MSKCMNCGKEGPHYVPPSLGEPGFFHCEKNDSEYWVKNRDHEIEIATKRLASAKRMLVIHEESAREQKQHVEKCEQRLAELKALPKISGEK